MLNGAPTPQPDFYSVEHAQVLVVDPPGVLDNDSDPDNDPLTVVSNTEPANGYVGMNPDGSFSYTPNINFTGTDTFNYTVSDGTNTATASVSITVTNQAPTAVDDGPFSVLHGQTITGIDVLANDSDPDGDTLTPSVVNQPLHGNLAYDYNTKTYSYTADVSYTGSDSFSYKVNDGAADSNVATVSLDVTDQAPTGQDQYYYGFANETLSISVNDGLLYNASDPDGDQMTVDVTSWPTNGELNPNSDGSFSYTPAPDFVGTDSFVFQILDGALRSAFYSATVAIQAQPAQGVFVWRGTSNHFWNEDANWLGGTTPPAGSDVRIALAGPDDVYPDTLNRTGGAPLDVTVRSITVDPNDRHNRPRQGDAASANNMDLYGNLTITGAGGTSDWSYGDIHFNSNSNATLTIQNHFTWHSGGITGLGTVLVYSSDTSTAKLTITDDASTLAGPDLNIGLVNESTIKGGDVELVGMNGNLTIANNSDITVSSLGQLSFLQDLPANQSGTKDGIAKGILADNSEIDNYGTVYRAANGDGNASYVDVNIPVINKNDGLLYLGPQSAIRFNAANRTYDVQQDSGTVELGGGSQLIVPNGGLYVSAGTVQLDADYIAPNAVNAVVTVTGTTTLAGGSMNFGDASNVFVTFVTTTFNIDDGTIYMRVDGSDSTKNDKIQATTVNIDDSDAGPTLDVTVEGTITANQSWTLIRTPNGGLTRQFFYFFVHGGNLTERIDDGANYDALVIDGTP